MIPRESCNVDSKYVYVPLFCKDYESYLEQMSLENPKHLLYEKTYWYLDEFSCILVKRNVMWFQAAIPIIQKEWAVVERERKDGFDHRAPKARNKPKITLEGDPIFNPVDINMNKILIVKLDENGNAC